MPKIGIMGGTFDPIHNTHLALGIQAFQEYHLDAIWYMPSKCPPHKSGHVLADTKDRCEMVQIAIRPYPFMVFSDFELLREGKTYTADTLRLLHESYPEYQFYFIVGADSLLHIETWYHPEQVLTQTTFLVAGRLSVTSESLEEAEEQLNLQIAYLTDKYHAKIYRLHNSNTNLSSTTVRELVARGEGVRHIVPAEVAVYIEKYHLYQEVSE